MMKRINCQILHVRIERANFPGIIAVLNLSFFAKLNSSGFTAIVISFLYLNFRRYNWSKSPFTYSGITFQNGLSFALYINK